MPIESPGSQNRLRRVIANLKQGMALAWAEALETPRVLVVEAPTGIGKTLAYLVPALLSRRNTTVTHGTRTHHQHLTENAIHPVRAPLPAPGGPRGGQAVLAPWGVARRVVVTRPCLRLRRHR